MEASLQMSDRSLVRYLGRVLCTEMQGLFRISRYEERRLIATIDHVESVVIRVTYTLDGPNAAHFAGVSSR